MKTDDYSYVDRMIGDALRTVTAGVDPDKGAETVADALSALAKQAKALKEVEYLSSRTKRVVCVSCGELNDVELPNAAELSKTMMQTAKMIDETARLVQFVNGKPDSRPEVAGMPTDVLKALTNEQLAQVMAWVTMNGEQQEVSAREASPGQ